MKKELAEIIRLALKWLVMGIFKVYWFILRISILVLIVLGISIAWFAMWVYGEVCKHG